MVRMKESKEPQGGKKSQVLSDKAVSGIEDADLSVITTPLSSSESRNGTSARHRAA